MIDASVVVKWYFPESGSDAALALLEAGAPELVAPDLLAIEVCAAFVRGANMEPARSDGASLFISDFRGKLANEDISVRRTSHDALVNAAIIAIAIGHSLKDCVYLALAMELGCPLVTCDAKFAARARGVWGEVEVLGEAGR